MLRQRCVDTRVTLFRNAKLYCVPGVWKRPLFSVWRWKTKDMVLCRRSVAQDDLFWGSGYFFWSFKVGGLFESMRLQSRLSSKQVLHYGLHPPFQDPTSLFEKAASLMNFVTVVSSKTNHKEVYFMANKSKKKKKIDNDLDVNEEKRRCEIWAINELI